VPKLRILHVDDDPSIRHVVARALGHAGMDVDCVGTAAEVSAALSRCAYDVVIVDRHIGRDDGLALIARLRDDAPYLPMLLLSGSLDRLAKDQAHALGVVRCILKGGPLHELIDAVWVAAKGSGTIRRDELGAADDTRRQG
jgi:CheY-like chemotaxis protein